MNILETPRLVLRELVPADYASLCKTLQDPVAMTAYEHAFSNDEVQTWLTRQRNRYTQDGFGLWAVEDKTCGQFLGQCGLTLQECFGDTVLEVGYLLERTFWHRGYATEAAIACRDYAFSQLGAPEVFSIIRDTNLPSQRVALRNGMAVRGSFVKHYCNVAMPHLVFSVRRAPLDGAPALLA